MGVSFSQAVKVVNIYCSEIYCQGVCLAAQLKIAITDIQNTVVAHLKSVADFKSIC